MCVCVGGGEGVGGWRGEGSFKEQLTARKKNDFIEANGLGI